MKIMTVSVILIFFLIILIFTLEHGSLKATKERGPRRVLKYSDISVEENGKRQSISLIPLMIWSIY